MSRVPGKFGKLAPKLDYRTLRFRKYLSAGLPAAPGHVDNVVRMEAVLGITHPTALFPMDANDSYGDCTIAAKEHATTLFDGLTGVKSIASEQACLREYLALTGGADSGLACLDVLKYWQKSGGISAYASVNPKNLAEVRTAIWLFGGVYVGFQVPENAQAEFAQPTPWTPGTLTLDGHCVFAYGYDADYVYTLTWGSTQRGTWAWWESCVDEAYAVLPAVGATMDPGFDLATLQADLALLT